MDDDYIDQLLRDMIAARVEMVTEAICDDGLMLRGTCQCVIRAGISKLGGAFVCNTCGKLL